MKSIHSKSVKTDLLKHVIMFVGSLVELLWLVWDHYLLVRELIKINQWLFLNFVLFDFSHYSMSIVNLTGCLPLNRKLGRISHRFPNTQPLFRNFFLSFNRAQPWNYFAQFQKRNLWFRLWDSQLQLGVNWMFEFYTIVMPILHETQVRASLDVLGSCGLVFPLSLHMN